MSIALGKQSLFPVLVLAHLVVAQSTNSQSEDDKDADASSTNADKSSDNSDETSETDSESTSDLKDNSDSSDSSDSSSEESSKEVSTTEESTSEKSTESASTTAKPSTVSITATGDAASSITSFPSAETSGSSTRLTGLPTLPSLTSETSYTTPAIAIPTAEGNPFIYSTNHPPGTIFIAVGSIIGGLLVALLAWRIAVAMMLRSELKKSSKRTLYNSSDDAHFHTEMTDLTAGGTHLTRRSSSAFELLNRAGAGASIYDGSNMSFDNFGQQTPYSALGPEAVGNNVVVPGAPGYTGSMFVSPTADILATGGLNSAAYGGQPKSRPPSNIFPTGHYSTLDGDEPVSTFTEESPDFGTPSVESQRAESVNSNINSVAEAYQRRGRGNRVIPSVYLDKIFED